MDWKNINGTLVTEWNRRIEQLIADFNNIEWQNNISIKIAKGEKLDLFREK